MPRPRQTPREPRRRQRKALPATAAPTQPDADALKQRDQELEAARAAQREAEENQAKLKREIEALGADRSALNAQLIDTAARVRDVEANIEATRARLEPLDDREHLFTTSLAERQTAIVEILAALQRIGRRPPPALLVEPEDALKAVRTAITLGAVLPQMRAQADAIAGDLADLLRVRKDIDGERERLARDLALLGREQLRMNMLIDERQSKQSAAEQALDAERQRAADLAHQVDSLQGSHRQARGERRCRHPRRARGGARTPRTGGRTSPRSRIRAG